MRKSDLRVRVGTSISPYRGSTCYKRRTSPFQNIHIGPQAGIEKGTKRVYLPLQYSGMYHGPIYSSFKKKKRFFRLRTKCCFQAGSLSNRSQRAYRFRIPPRSNKADPCTTHQIKLGEVESKQERQPKRKQEERADEARPAQVHKRIPRDEY